MTKPKPMKPVKAWALVAQDGRHIAVWLGLKRSMPFRWIEGERIARVEIREISK